MLKEINLQEKNQDVYNLLKDTEIYSYEVKDNKICSKNIKGVINVCGYGIYDVKNPRCLDNRYYLELDILNNENCKHDGTIITLMMNPSWTFPFGAHNSGIDRTVKNVIKIAKVAKIPKSDLKFSKVIVLNTMPIITSEPEQAMENNSQQNINVKFVKNFLEKSNKMNAVFLAAWGSNNDINKYNEFIDEINSFFKDKIYVYDINDSQPYPCHPSGQGVNSKKLKKFLLESQTLKPVKISKDLTVEEI